LTQTEWIGPLSPWRKPPKIVQAFIKIGKMARHIVACIVHAPIFPGEVSAFGWLFWLNAFAKTLSNALVGPIWHDQACFILGHPGTDRLAGVRLDSRNDYPRGRYRSNTLKFKV
jgi:hypothetical protein